MGRLALLGGLSGASMDVPPFMILQYINVIAGVNVIGMRRAGVSNGAIDAIRKAFHAIYRSDMLLKTSLAQVERDHGTYRRWPNCWRSSGRASAASRWTATGRRRKVGRISNPSSSRPTCVPWHTAFKDGLEIPDHRGLWGEVNL